MCACLCICLCLCARMWACALLYAVTGGCMWHAISSPVSSLPGSPAAALSARAEQLISNSVAAATQHTYAPGWHAFRKFMQQIHRDPLSPRHDDILLFAASMSHSVSAGTLKVYLAAVRYNLLCRGGPVEVLPSSRLTALVKGLERERASLPRHATAQPRRQAITAAQLKALHLFLQRSAYSPGDTLMLWAALTTAFHGLLRVSEYTSPSPAGSGTLKTLRRAHLVLSQATASLRLQRTKTSQLTSGGEVVLHRHADPQICPVLALEAYVRSCAWGSDEQPLFKFGNGRWLTPNDINVVLRRVLGPSYSSHSLRAGGATHMANQGAPEYALMAAGRWSSGAYRTYVRRPAGMPRRY
ncbi:uncharacterized protein LOC135805446 isoform X2 [Sycon ciliatum]|uniref:uncharacterized protein LOC135805446 isoform X2 n=1 Tax=Sycon ciliatum TaxID=27933 RepID=UPI0031F6809B